MSWPGQMYERLRQSEGVELAAAGASGLGSGVRAEHDASAQAEAALGGTNAGFGATS